ncbi:Y-family DNA polymerase [Aurantiacibacter aquimixticola]|nr:DNA polymerase Y family protein [Aurantiacibacter aquimixticola]
MSRRIVSIWIPHLPIERWLRYHRPNGSGGRQADAHAVCGKGGVEAGPIVLSREDTHGPVIHAVTPAARDAGARVGVRVVDARALDPSLKVEEADPAGDAAWLARLAIWCRRWCPASAVDGDDGLVLDTGGADHLWGGEAAMLEDIVSRFRRLGHGVRLAVAPTHGAAWALARHGAQGNIRQHAEGLEKALAPLPVTALRLDAETVLLLRRLGLKTIGQLAAVPRLSLARRFRTMVSRGKPLETPLRQLDRALGRAPEPLVAATPPQRFRVVRRLAEPLPDPYPHLMPLLQELCGKLDAADHGVRRLRFEAFRADGDVGYVEVATASPVRAPEHLVRLFDERLDRLDPLYGFDAFAMEALWTEPLAPAQVRLDGDEADGVAAARLVDRLIARLGPDAVMRPMARESHVPERAEGWIGVLAPKAAPPAPPPERERPLRMLRHPEEIRVLYAVPEGPPAQFVWRHQTHRIARHEGPERIAPEWWREKSTARLRDYYRVEDSEGRRYWLFREGLHGDGRGDDPRWFLHGMFA